MDSSALHSLAALLRSQRAAALGVIRDETPLVTLVVYALAPNNATFYLHLSGLAWHTRALRANPRAGLMVAYPDTNSGDPQTLARVSLQGEAWPIPKATAEFEAIKRLYLARFPAAERNFELTDFDLYAFTPHTARYVADFGKIYTLEREHFQLLGK